MTGPDRLRIAILAGLVAGLLILGAGGRVVMRLLAYLTTAPPRFTLVGTLQVLALGTIWGGLSAPIWLLLHRVHSRRVRVLAYAAATLGLAALGFALLATFTGRLVAPPRFLLLGAALFPLLFLVHAGLVEWLATRWSKGVRTQ